MSNDPSADHPMTDIEDDDDHVSVVDLSDDWVPPSTDIVLVKRTEPYRTLTLGDLYNVPEILDAGLDDPTGHADFAASIDGLSTRVGPIPNRSPACVICRSDIDISESVLYHNSCNKTFHFSCLMPWVMQNLFVSGSSTCPLCRADLRVGDVNRQDLNMVLKSLRRTEEAVAANEEESVHEDYEINWDVQTDLDFRPQWKQIAELQPVIHELERLQDDTIDRIRELFRYQRALKLSTFSQILVVLLRVIRREGGVLDQETNDFMASWMVLDHCTSQAAVRWVPNIIMPWLAERLTSAQEGLNADNLADRAGALVADLQAKVSQTIMDNQASVHAEMLRIATQANRAVADYRASQIP